MGESEVFPDRELAINPGQVSGTLPGSATKDPAFGLDAVWVEKSRREQAQAQGYTVVDASSVIATHLSHLLQSHAHELLGHEEVQQLLNRLGKSAPKLIEDLVPKLLPMSVVVKVLQYLLLERVPIRNLRTICETLAELAPKNQDPVSLVAAVRVALGRSIVQNIGGLRQELPVITLDPGARAGAAGFDGKRRRRLARIRARPRRQNSGLARGQHAAPGGRGRTRGAAGGAENSAVDCAVDAPLDAVARSACLQRDTGEPPHPRDRCGRTLILLDFGRLS